MRNRQHGVLLACLILVIGCQRYEPAPTTSAASTNTVTASNTSITAPEPQADLEEPQAVSTVPLISKELKGVWYGVTRDTGVVIQFIGRQSREKDLRGVLSGEWVVCMDRGSIGSAIEFTDNATSGAVDLAVDLVNNDTQKASTAKLGRVERGSDGILYLSIYKNPTEDMYVPVSRIPLQRVDGHNIIERADIDQMQQARKQMQSV